MVPDKRSHLSLERPPYRDGTVGKAKPTVGKDSAQSLQWEVEWAWSVGVFQGQESGLEELKGDMLHVGTETWTNALSHRAFRSLNVILVW